MSNDSPKVGFVSLGCPKATVDSELILTQLRAEGYTIVPSYESADLVVINTCGFIEDAITESLDSIGEAALVEIRPEQRSEVQLGIRTFPQEEIAYALLTAGSYEKINERQSKRI